MTEEQERFRTGAWLLFFFGSSVLLSLWRSVPWWVFSFQTGLTIGVALEFMATDRMRGAIAAFVVPIEDPRRVNPVAAAAIRAVFDVVYALPRFLDTRAPGDWWRTFWPSLILTGVVTFAFAEWWLTQPSAPASPACQAEPALSGLWSMLISRPFWSQWELSRLLDAFTFSSLWPAIASSTFWSVLTSPPFWIALGVNIIADFLALFVIRSWLDDEGMDWWAALGVALGAGISLVISFAGLRALLSMPLIEACDPAQACAAPHIRGAGWDRQAVRDLVQTVIKQQTPGFLSACIVHLWLPALALTAVVMRSRSVNRRLKHLLWLFTSQRPLLVLCSVAGLLVGTLASFVKALEISPIVLFLLIPTLMAWMARSRGHT